MKRSILLLLVVFSSFPGSAQKFSTEKGTISFFSDAAIEDIAAENTMVGSLFNSTTGELVYIVKIKDFVFPKALMREHFNEKYMETEKFPKSLFTGKLKGYDVNAKGEQNVVATGKMTIHGVTKDISVPGTIQGL
jgi:YceI-like domain